ncbi:MAG: tetratricopeptide repeat protein [Bacteroidaceae bacterium]|nr:tetratricopeptide repeat protein [Bacteroidaceae bacterium]
MTADEDFKKRAQRIKVLLLQNRLREALELVQVQMAGVTDWSVMSRFEDIDRSYRYMLQYYSQGSPDKHRNEVYRQLVRRALLLNDDVLQARLQPESMLLYYQHLRSQLSRTENMEGLRLSLESFADNHDIAAHERVLGILFDLIWTNGAWSSGDSASLMELIDSPAVAEDDSLIAVSAVTLSLMERFDPLKCLFLCQASENPDMPVSIRALTGLAVTMAGYADILPYFPEVTDRITLLSDVPGIRERMLKVQMALLLCRETKEIDRRMREEIIPTMLRNPKLGDLMREELERDDVSPDWNEWIEKPEIKDKLMQMTELQMEGADVYMSTFSGLKSYPFFRSIHNWFRVFSLDQPDVKQSLGENFMNSTIGRSMLTTGVFCNSDKYSFALTFSQIPEAQRDMIMGQMDGQFEEEVQEMQSGTVSADVRENYAARQYAQDLYRFFNLFSRRHEFRNPFDDNINMLTDNPLSILLESDDSEHEIASWLMRKGYFSEAVTAFRLMERNIHPYSTDYRFYQQMGYALQREQRYEEALEAYNRADILQPDNPWTLRHTAQCQRLTAHPKEALELLLQAEKLDADNLSLQIQIGDCLVDLKRYDEALTRFFKVDYLKPDYVKAWRAIAWCAFLADRKDRSLEYYEKILAGSPSGEDCLNAAHVCLTDGDVQRAVALYSRSARILGRERFESEFNADRPVLMEKGISEQDFPLLLDLIP